MNENTNVKPAYVSPLKRICMTIGELPSSYIETMSYYEMLVWFCEYLRNTIIPTVNNNASAVQELQQLYEELQNYVNNYFDNLDVQEEINNKLDEMASDGTLQELINQYIQIQQVNYIKDICTLSYRPSSATRGLQGGCYCGNNTIACYFSSTHTIQIISLSTGNVLREYSQSIFGHGNGLCKVGNYLYLCGTGDSNNNVYKIPYDTLNSYEVINVFASGLIPAGSNISSICYNPTNEHFYITLGLPFPTLTCYELNEDLDELIATYTYNNGTSSYGGFITNICCWNNYIVCNYNYGKTQLFNANDFTLYKEITIDKNVGNRYYSEIEWLDTYENNLLLIGAICESGEGYGNGVFSFGTCDLHNSTRDFPGNYKRGKSTTGEINVNQNNIFVNTNADFNVKRDGTQDNPFISIYEATNSTQLDGFNETIIHIVSGSDITDEGIYLSNTKIVKILAPADNLICRDMRFQSNEMVYIKGITPNNTLYMKETNVTLYATPSSETSVELEGYNTSVLNVHTTFNKIKLLGSSAGIINFTNFNTENGIVGVLNSSADGYTDFVNCRNINNVMQRGRLSGNAYTPSTSMTFFLNLASVKDIWVQLGSTNYIRLPICNPYGNKTYSVPIPDSTALTVKITQDTTTYANRTVWKYELEHASLTIYDSVIIY